MSQISSTYKLLGGADLIGTGFVNSALYGISFVLYCFSARLLYQQLEDPYQRRRSLITLIHASIVIACGFCALALDAWRYKISYVDHGDYPGGGYRYQSIAQGLPMGIASSSLLFAAMDCFTQGIQIWRLWVVWNMSRYATLMVLLPSLALLGFIGLEIAIATFDFHPELVHTDFALTLIPAANALSFFITISVAIAIIGRIAMIRRQHIKIMGDSDNSRQYTTIITMLIESFALDSIWLTVAIIFTALNHRRSPALFAGRQFITGTLSYIRLVSYLLVIYRVSANRGWEKDTERHLTSIQWNHGTQKTTETAVEEPVTMSTV
ncbi:hypothetical protein D9756_002102 [Leucocoprinus leucothites]|uniref:Uncharacterized protein n=1 Tax=Leucocoprinus leucothites TaxID=201217 RepID=A0A8H5GCN2_9AGAR|nr:hypothetical protein D9756_002102 [Leucoagaricus leucothites]